MDPTGGLRPISSLGAPKPAANNDSDYDADASLVDSRRRGGKLRRIEEGGIYNLNQWRLDPLKAGYRLRLVARIVSMIASGTTFASLADVMFNYDRTRNVRTKSGKLVWPEGLDMWPSITVMMVAIVCFLIDLTWFVMSAKPKIRFLSTRKLKIIAFSLAVFILLALASAISYSELAHTEDGPDAENGTLNWVCTAKVVDWDFDGKKTVDFVFYCGELGASAVSRYVTLCAQVVIVGTVLWDGFYRPPKPKMPKLYLAAAGPGEQVNWWGKLWWPWGKKGGSYQEVNPAVVNI